MRDKIGTLLWLLAAFDGSLTLWAFFAPDTWFALFHGSPRVDPQALLQRCGANWAAFCAIQGIAALRWRKEGYWLAVVGGCRLGDCLTDVTCLLFAERTTVFAWVGFPLAGLANLVIGGLLVRAYARSLSRPAR